MHGLLMLLASVFMVGYSQDLDAIMVGIYGVAHPTAASVKRIDNTTDKVELTAVKVTNGTVVPPRAGVRQRREAGAGLIGTIERGDGCEVRGQKGRCIYYGDCKFSFHANGSWYWQEAVKLCKVQLDVCCPTA